MKIPAGGGQLTQQRRQVSQKASHHVTDLAATGVVALSGAVHGQQLGMQQFAALALFQGCPDDHVDRAGFILQRDKGHAPGGAGALPQGDQAAGSHQPAVGQRTQLGRVG